MHSYPFWSNFWQSHLEILLSVSIVYNIWVIFFCWFKGSICSLFAKFFFSLLYICFRFSSLFLSFLFSFYFNFYLFKLYHLHLALQPWTPCLLIRGGKLKTSKPFSTSNPQLPFVCSHSQPPFALGSSAPSHFPPSSTNSLNSSFIWREASPNNFNLYSTSVSSLNGGGYRYSLGGAGVTKLQFSPTPADHRALSEERATRKSLNRMKSGFGSGYDNIFMTPLMPRKSKHILKNVYYSHQHTPPPPLAPESKSDTSSPKQPLLMRNRSEEQPSPERYPSSPGLYDRRLNRSFETGSRGYGQLYTLKQNTLQRSTPQLAADVDTNDLHTAEQQSICRGCGAGLLRNGRSSGSTDSTASDVDSQRHSATWCCGNFVIKQWRKINNYW